MPEESEDARRQPSRPMTNGSQEPPDAIRTAIETIRDRRGRHPDSVDAMGRVEAWRVANPTAPPLKWPSVGEYTRVVLRRLWAEGFTAAKLTDLVGHSGVEVLSLDEVYRRVVLQGDHSYFSEVREQAARVEEKIRVTHARECHHPQQLQRAATGDMASLWALATLATSHEAIHRRVVSTRPFETPGNSADHGLYRQHRLVEWQNVQQVVGGGIIKPCDRGFKYEGAGLTATLTHAGLGPGQEDERALQAFIGDAAAEFLIWILALARWSLGKQIPKHLRLHRLHPSVQLLILQSGIGGHRGVKRFQITMPRLAERANKIASVSCTIGRIARAHVLGDLLGRVKIRYDDGHLLASVPLAPRHGVRWPTSTGPPVSELGELTAKLRTLYTPGYYPRDAVESAAVQIVARLRDFPEGASRKQLELQLRQEDFSAGYRQILHPQGVVERSSKGLYHLPTLVRSYLLPGRSGYEAATAATRARRESLRMFLQYDLLEGGELRTVVVPWTRVEHDLPLLVAVDLLILVLPMARLEVLHPAGYGPACPAIDCFRDHRGAVPDALISYWHPGLNMRQRAYVVLEVFRTTNPISPKRQRQILQTYPFVRGRVHWITVEASGKSVTPAAGESWTVGDEPVTDLEVVSEVYAQLRRAEDILH